LTKHYSTEFCNHPGAILEMCVLHEHFEAGLHIFSLIPVHLGSGLRPDPPATVEEVTKRADELCGCGLLQ
jgi:hypothetical protein